MNAIQFIKEQGVEKARKVIEGAPEGATHLSDGACHYVNADFKPLPAHIKEQLPELIVIDDLKRLVESVDFINKFGGINLAKAYDKQMSAHGFDPFFDKTIADYESIYGVSMFKVGQDVVLKNSSQNKVMKIQAHNDEFIRAYWSKKEYSFAHESNFRHATPQEIALGHRIDTNTGVTVITPKGTSKVKGGLTAFVDMGDDSHIENHISPLCKMGGEVMRSEFDLNKFRTEFLQSEGWGVSDCYKPYDDKFLRRDAQDAYEGAKWAWNHKQSKIDELQKRVDAVKGLAQTLWEKSEEKHHQGKVWESKTLGECADEILDVLEQALKGGDQNTEKQPNKHAENIATKGVKGGDQ